MRWKLSTLSSEVSEVFVSAQKEPFFLLRVS
jgi:hypothetical protein